MLDNSGALLASPFQSTKLRRAVCLAITSPSLEKYLLRRSAGLMSPFDLMDMNITDWVVNADASRPAAETLAGSYALSSRGICVNVNLYLHSYISEH